MWTSCHPCQKKNSCAQTHESEPLRAKDSAPPQRWVQNNQSYTCRALFSPLRSFDFPTFGPFLPPSVSWLFARAGTCQFIFKFKCKNRIRTPAKRIELNLCTFKIEYCRQIIKYLLKKCLIMQNVLFYKLILNFQHYFWRWCTMNSTIKYPLRPFWSMNEFTDIKKENIITDN